MGSGASASGERRPVGGRVRPLGERHLQIFTFFEPSSAPNLPERHPQEECKRGSCAVRREQGGGRGELSGDRSTLIMPKDRLGALRAVSNQPINLINLCQFYSLSSYPFQVKAKNLLVECPFFNIS